MIIYHTLLSLPYCSRCRRCPTTPHSLCQWQRAPFDRLPLPPTTPLSFNIDVNVVYILQRLPCGSNSTNPTPFPHMTALPSLQSLRRHRPYTSWSSNDSRAAPLSPIPPTLWMAVTVSSSNNSSSNNTTGHHDTAPIDQAFVNVKYQVLKEVEVEGWAPLNPVCCL